MELLSQQHSDKPQKTRILNIHIRTSIRTDPLLLVHFLCYVQNYSQKQMFPVSFQN
jgi:hypothetical protein